MSGGSHGAPPAIITFVNYVYLVVVRACSESLDWAQAFVFAVIIIVGFATRDAHHSQMLDFMATWHFAAIALGGAVGIRLALSPFWIYLDQVDRIAVLEAESLGTSDNTLGDALGFEFGHNGGFVKKTMLASGSCRYEAIVRLRNKGNGFITSVVVRIKGSSPALPEEAFKVLKPGSTLQKGEPTYIYLATYFDKVDGLHNEFIRLASPIMPGWGSRPTDITPPSANAPLKLVIEATADGCAAKEMHFLIWVDSAKELRVREG